MFYNKEISNKTQIYLNEFNETIVATRIEKLNINNNVPENNYINELNYKNGRSTDNKEYKKLRLIKNLNNLNDFRRPINIKFLDTQIDSFENFSNKKLESILTTSKFANLSKTENGLFYSNEKNEKQISEINSTTSISHLANKSNYSDFLKTSRKDNFLKDKIQFTTSVDGKKIENINCYSSSKVNNLPKSVSSRLKIAQKEESFVLADPSVINIDLQKFQNLPPFSHNLKFFTNLNELSNNLSRKQINENTVQKLRKLLNFEEFTYRKHTGIKQNHKLKNFKHKSSIVPNVFIPKQTLEIKSTLKENTLNFTDDSKALPVAKKMIHSSDLDSDFQIKIVITDRSFIHPSTPKPNINKCENCLLCEEEYTSKIKSKESLVDEKIIKLKTSYDFFKKNPHILLSHSISNIDFM